MRKPNLRKSQLPRNIDFDTWAESGGTRGIFAKGVRNGTIKIVDL
jgi:hypothetical protein